MKKISAFFVVTLFCMLLTSSTKQITIFIIGDSTAANKSNYKTNPERGWGMVLQGFYDARILVDNHAVNGQSSKSFIDDGRWKKVIDKVKPGDYVFIQFGHNDEKPNPKRHTDPGSTFDDNLRKFCRETMEKGGHPVLFNAVVRRNFMRKVDSTVEDESLRSVKYGDEEVNSDTLIDTHGAYLFPPKYIAKELGVPFVDANRVTHDIEQGMGIEGSRKLHMWLKPGEVESIPDGRKDNTHYNIYGARVVAEALAKAIAQEVPALKKYIIHYDYVVSEKGKGNYLTLQDAVNAAPMGKKTKILILDGTWEKPVIPQGKKIRFKTFPEAKVK
ncbi:MAG: pectin esterase [Prevotella sp.]|nr:pectin esterase [Prevotella sp.]